MAGNIGIVPAAGRGLTYMYAGGGACGGGGAHPSADAVSAGPRPRLAGLLKRDTCATKQKRPVIPTSFEDLL